MELIKWDDIRHQIEVAQDIEVLTDMKDKLRAYQILAEQSKQSAEVQSKIAIYKARADRKCGEWLDKNIKHGGQNKKAKSHDVISLSDVGITPNESSRLQKIASIPEDEFEATLSQAEAEVSKITNNMLVTIAKGAHVANNSGNNEWYTPEKYITKAREIMGAIMLDPASNPKANETVKAPIYYTEETNGLDKDWVGNIWLNPPYAQPLIQQFADKLVQEVDNGNVKQACVLVNNATETKWFKTMASRAKYIWFIDGRVKFIDTDGNASGAPLQGQAFLYIGKGSFTVDSGILCEVK